MSGDRWYNLGKFYWFAAGFFIFTSVVNFLAGDMGEGAAWLVSAGWAVSAGLSARSAADANASLEMMRTLYRGDTGDRETSVSRYPGSAQ